MALSARTIQVGDQRTAVVVDNLTRTQLVQYAGASGDYNPLHSDEIYTTQIAGYPSVFAHGMLSMGATGRVLTDWVGDGRLLGYGVRFVRQVWPGDTLTARATVVAVRTSRGDGGDWGDGSDGAGGASADPVVELSVVCTNQHGEEVVTGTATARLDP